MLVDVLERAAQTSRPRGRIWRAAEQARATRYAAVQERLIAPDGSFPPIGRSIAYRCGAFHALAQAALRTRAAGGRLTRPGSRRAHRGHPAIARGARHVRRRTAGCASASAATSRESARRTSQPAACISAPSACCRSACRPRTNSGRRRRSRGRRRRHGPGRRFRSITRSPRRAEWPRRSRWRNSSASTPSRHVRPARSAVYPASYCAAPIRGSRLHNNAAKRRRGESGRIRVRRTEHDGARRAFGR